MSVSTQKHSSEGSGIYVSHPLPKQKMREIVLQMLYALEIDPSTEDGLVGLLMAEIAVAQRHALSGLLYAKKILENSTELDLLVSKAIKSTPIHKITLMEKNVLRLIVFEYLQGQPISPAILIAEATRLTKKFSYKEACSFVHAVLNDIFQLLVPQEEKTHLSCC